MDGRYGIGEIAGILGISTELLRHYERKNIITPKRDENGYRYYDLDTVKKLTGVRRSRAFGFSLEDADRLLVSGSREETVALHRERLLELERELQWKGLVTAALRELVEELERVVEEEGLCRLTELGPMLRYNFQHNRAFFPSGPDHLRWQDGMPVVSISPGFSLDAIQAGSDECDFGFVVSQAQGKFLALEETAGAYQLPGGMAVTTIISSKGTNHIKAVQMQPALHFAECHGWQPIGDAWGITVHNFDQSKYHRMYLPVKKL